MNNESVSQKGELGDQSLEGKKIMVIEDDRFLHRLLIDKLTQWKATVASSYDGLDAVKKVAEEKPDLILLDIILPGADGFDILGQLKLNETLKNIPVIILSNLGQEEDIERGTKLGAVDFLIKANFTLDEIATKVSKVLTKAA